MQEPQLKQHSEVLSHYCESESPGTLQCKYCGAFFSVKGSASIDHMAWHTRTYHHSPGPRRYSLEQKLDKLKPPPKYLSKYAHQSAVSDQWLDRLILDGYPVEQIMDHLMRRLTDGGQVLANLSRRSHALLQAKQLLLQFLPQLPLHLLPHECTAIMSSTFKVPPSACSLILRHHSWPHKKPPQIYHQLQELGVRLRVIRDGDADACVVFANHRMRQLYSQFGEVVNVETRFVPLKRAPNGMHYNLVLFTGQDRGVCLVVFGIALVNGYNFKNIKACIKEFLSIVDQKLPSIFVTNQESLYHQAILEINYQLGSRMRHIVNWHYCIEKLKTAIMNQSVPGHSLKKIAGALSATSQTQFESFLMEIKESDLFNEDLVKQFQQNAHTCCFARAEPVFVGFGVQEERVEGITKLVDHSFFYINRLGLFYTLAFRLEHKCNSMVVKSEGSLESTPSQHRVSEMRYLSTVLEPNIYSKLLHLYTHSLNKLQVSPQHAGEPIFRVRDTTKPQSRSIFWVRYSVQDQCWRCSCNLIYWSGLPCDHLIKIVRHFGGSIAYYINSRWMPQDALQNLPPFEEDQLHDVKIGRYRPLKQDRTPQSPKQSNEEQGHSHEQKVKQGAVPTQYDATANENN